jgi:hypothetical protein
VTNLDLDTDHNRWSDFTPASARQALEDDYDRLLHQQTIQELRAAARRWDVQIKGTRKADIVRQLAAWLNDPVTIRAQIDDLDDLGREVLTYLHLALAPDYGISADNIVRGMAQQQERAQQQAEDELSLPVKGHSAGRSPWQKFGAAIQERIAALNQQGLLLPFKQGSLVYYSMPAAVRLCLPSRPDLLGDPDQADELRIQETTFGRSVQTLYAIWMALAKGHPTTRKPFVRQAPPIRQAKGDTWPSLQGWNNDPDELAALTSGRYARSRYAAGANYWALTVLPPPHRLSEADVEHLGQQSDCSASEVEFFYVLLEGLGVLAGEPGEAISVDKEAMFRFLRLSSPAKVHALWQVWANSETWSEMETVLRTKELRLRRTLTYFGFEPADLYQEWKQARKTMQRFLSLLEVDRWVPIDRFLQIVYSVHPDLLHAQTDASVWWLESPKTNKQFGTTIEDWRESHGQFVLAIIEGPLHRLGLVRLGYTSAQEPALKAFQLTPAGAYALGRSPTLAPDALSLDRAREANDTGQAACSIDDDLIITLRPGNVPLDLYDLIHAVGDLREATPDRFVYRLAASKVFRWAEATASQDNADPSTSHAIEKLIAVLSQHCVPPGEQRQVAAGWQRKLRTWSSNYGQLHIHEDLTLIELADDYALQELLVSTSLQEYMVYQFSPRLAAIHADAVDELVEEMEKRGYTPRVR